MSNSWKLRILNTDHAGAEVTLNQSMKLGSDEEQADLVINANFVSPHFVTLVPDEQGVKLVAEDDKVEIIGEKILEDDDYAPLQQVIFVGELIIALCSDAEPWADAIVNFSQSNQGVAATSQKTSGRERQGVQPNGKILFSWLAMGQYVRKPKVQAIGGGAILLSVALWIFMATGTPNSVSDSMSLDMVDTLQGTVITNSKEKREMESMTSALSEMLSDQDYRYVTVHQVEGTGSIQVSGYVQDDSMLQRLHMQLNELFPLVDVNVHSIEKIQQSARLILGNIGLVPEVIEQGDTPGSFIAVIDGDYMTSWENAKSLLLSDVAGLNSWELKVKQTLTPLKRLQQLASSYAIANKLSYLDGADKIQIVARLNSAEEKALRELMEEFRMRVGDTPKLEHITSNLAEEKLSLNDFGIVAVRGGDNPYVTFRNGKRYLLGSRLPNGTNIEHFAEGELTVLRGAETYVIRYEKKDAFEAEIAYQELLNP